jgi:hypothetical protein
MVKRSRREITDSDRRSWLDQYERGVGVTKIARNAHRNFNAVKAHIARARDERMKAAARQTYLVGLIVEHQRNLLDTALTMRADVSANRSILIPEDGVKGKMFNGLRQHLSRRPLFKLVADYQGEYKRREQTWEKVVEALKTLAADASQTLGDDLLFDWPQTARNLLDRRRREPAHEPHVRRERADDNAGLYVRADAYQLLLRPVDPSLATAVESAFAAFWDGTKALTPLWQEACARLRIAGLKGNDEIDGLEASNMVPGKCDYCPL